MAVFFTADLHFGHKNVMAFDDRPFKDIESHDAELIDRWNNKVGIDDEVYILGDISWHNSTKTIEILKQLNGNLHLIKGNHDAKLLKNRDVQKMFVEICDYKEWHNSTKTIEILKQLNGNLHLIKGNHDAKLLKNRDVQKMFVEICDYKELYIADGKILVLCHYPIPCFKNHYYGSYHFYGHVHIGFEHNMMLNVKRRMEESYHIPCNMHNVGTMLWNFEPVTFEEVTHVHIGFEHNMMLNVKRRMEESYHIPCNMHNVGTMLWNFEPVTFEEVTGERVVIK